MTRHNVARWTIYTAAALLTPLLISCESNQQHEEWVDEANNRWLSARSAMMLESAHQQFEAGDLDQATRYVKNGLSVDPDNARFHLLGGRIAMERGELERAYHLFKKASDLDSTLAAAFYYEGVVAQRWQRYEDALQAYFTAYEIEPDHFPYLQAVGETLVSLDDAPQAIDLLADKLEYFDQSASLRAMLGHLYVLDNRYDKAAKMFREASLLDPENVKTKEELALALIGAGRTEEAVKLLNDLIELPDMKDRKDLHRSLASAYMDLGQEAAARQVLLSIARRDDATADDWRRLAELAWRMKDEGTTLAAATKVVNLAPRDPRGYLLAGLAWQKRGNVENAVDMFDQAAALAPADAEPLILRGITLQRAGRPNAAAEAYQQALDRQPADTRARRLLAAVETTAP